MPPEATNSLIRLASLWSKNERLIRIVAIVAGIGIVATIWLLRSAITTPEAVGYPGVLFFSFLGSSTMLLPIPGLLSVCVGAIALNPIVVGLIGGIGEAAGELTGYAVGYGGRGVVERRGFYIKTKEWMERRGILVLFLASTIPNPFFDVVGIAAGATRFPIGRFLVTVWVGKTIKSILIAEACFYGVKLWPWTG